MATMTFDRPQKPQLRSWAVLAAVVTAIMTAPVLSWTGIGLPTDAFAADGDKTLRAAPYAFSIWGLIYLALFVYAVWQALKAAPETPALKAVAWPSAIATAGCALWLVVAALNIKALTVVVIFASAMAMIVGLLRAVAYRDGLGRVSHALIFWPLGLLGGWLTIASALNLLTVLTAWGLIGPDSAKLAALAGIGGVLLVGSAIVWRLRHIAYGLPIAWGLVAVWVAERADKPQVALAAAGAAAAMLVISIIAARRR
jgi:hypothetical protein